MVLTIIYLYLLKGKKYIMLMLKKPVSLFHFVKTKIHRYYHVPPNFQNDICIIKKKYDMPKEVLEIIENQQKNLIYISNKVVDLKASNNEFIKINKELQNYWEESNSYLWVICVSNSGLLLLISLIW